MQNAHQSLIVDEADSVLIDESTTPLLLSGPQDETRVCLLAFSKAALSAAKLSEQSDFVCDSKRRQIELTDSGIQKIHEDLQQYGKMSLFQPWSKYIENAIHSEKFLTLNEDYVVVDEQIKLVDQHTGRIFDDRQLRSGLHQALQAKEGVPLTPPNVTMARITRQRFFQLYRCICGMTGTATGSEPELAFFYKTPVIAIPPHRASQRIEFPDRFFANQESKSRPFLLTLPTAIHRANPFWLALGPFAKA